MAEAKKIGVVGATFLVAGNMMGSGVFLLPSSLAKIGTASIWGWLITTAGALLLAFVFAKLGKLAPKAGGPYAYARDWFGPYMGFQTNTIYWFANWIGNVAIPIAAVGYFSYFFPILSEPLVRCIAVLILVWALSFANMIGPAFVSRVQTVTTSFALVPILGIAIFGWFFFDADIFKGAYNVSGESNFGAISSAAALTLWAFIGVESASVTAGVVENPEKNVARATLAGVFLAAIAYIASSSVIMGMVPNGELQTSDAPFALAAAKAVGGWGGAVVSLCAFVGAAGSLGGWILLTAQSAKAASDDGLFPEHLQQDQQGRRAGQGRADRGRADDPGGAGDLHLEDRLGTVRRDHLGGGGVDAAAVHLLVRGLLFRGGAFAHAGAHRCVLDPDQPDGRVLPVGDLRLVGNDRAVRLPVRAVHHRVLSLLQRGASPAAAAFPRGGGDFGRRATFLS